MAENSSSNESLAQTENFTVGKLFYSFEHINALISLIATNIFNGKKINYNIVFDTRPNLFQKLQL